MAYEFSFFPSTKNRDVTSDSIVYADQKIYNVPDFICGEATRSIRSLLAKQTDLSDHEKKTLLQWLNTDDPMRATTSHIYYELTFKKLRRFRHEREYRYIHPDKPVADQRKITPLVDSKLTFDELGLRLDRVHTSSPDKVMEVLNKTRYREIRVSKPCFLDAV